MPHTLLYKITAQRSLREIWLSSGSHKMVSLMYWIGELEIKSISI